ncbi:MAG: SUMF1/EgtB/PvdO family nonheme iron enzyme [Candidatus Delongbacteria bacterium]|nr:SUMF1/EgtB/PvdO family nonheme iron enzyme [Candidatus Delongbacteria bacterium]
MKKLVLLALTVFVMTMFSQIPEMILVKGGSFKMGSEDGKKNEKPVHTVKLNDFYISKYEVKISEFLDFLMDYEKVDFKKTKRYAKFNKDGELTLLRSKVADDHQCAMYWVNWYLAVDYCNWLSEKAGFEQCYTVDGKDIDCDFTADGFRLLTEAEWEYATRGGISSKGYMYSGSNDHDKVAWTKENTKKIQVVGLKAPNELGIYDMSGNVSEMCWDSFDSDYYKDSVSENPTGPKRKSNKVIRGGSWKDKAKFATNTSRKYNAVFDKDKDLGIRIGRSVKAEVKEEVKTW